MQALGQQLYSTQCCVHHKPGMCTCPGHSGSVTRVCYMCLCNLRFCVLRLSILVCQPETSGRFPATQYVDRLAIMKCTVVGQDRICMTQTLCLLFFTDASLQQKLRSLKHLCDMHIDTCCHRPLARLSQDQKDSAVLALVMKSLVVIGTDELDRSVKYGHMHVGDQCYPVACMQCTNASVHSD